MSPSRIVNPKSKDYTQFWVCGNLVHNHHGQLVQAVGEWGRILFDLRTPPDKHFATISSMSGTCPECGARLPEDGACQTHFHELLALEWRIPGGPGLLPHFLAVTSYNLQHPSAFTPAARAHMHTSLEAGLSSRATITDLLERARRGFDGPTRVLRERGVAPGDGTGCVVAGWPSVWPRTVLDVLGSEPERTAYAALVQAWAEAVMITLRARNTPP